MSRPVTKAAKLASWAFAGYLTNMPDGGERYYTTPMGQALRAAHVAAYAAQRAAQEAR